MRLPRSVLVSEMRVLGVGVEIDAARLHPRDSRHVREGHILGLHAGLAPIIAVIADRHDRMIGIEILHPLVEQFLVPALAGDRTGGACFPNARRRPSGSGNR